MLSEERREFIAREVRDAGFAHASDLAARLEVSRATVWRDIDRLARMGVVAKVHGGAAAPTGHLAATAMPGRAVRGELTIGMQVPTGEYYYRSVTEGAREVCESFGARLVVGVSGYSGGDIDLEAIEGLVGIGADGLLLTPTSGPSHWSGVAPEFLSGLQVPVVLVERELAGLGGQAAASVTTAHESGIYAAVEHLVSLGHERVGMVTVATESRTRARMRNGFGTAALDFDLCDENGQPRMYEGNAGVPELLKTLQSADLTGVVVFGDSLAVALAHQIRAEGLRVPDDLSIVSYDDEIAASALPPLTAISPRRTELGQVAARQLLTHLLGGEELAGRRTQLEPRLVHRESTAAPGQRV